MCNFDFSSLRALFQFSPEEKSQILDCIFKTCFSNAVFSIPLYDPNDPNLYYLVLIYPTLSYPILFFSILSQHTISYPFLSYPIILYPIISYVVLCYPTLSCAILRYLSPGCRELVSYQSYSNLSHLILHHPTQRVLLIFNHVHSYPTLSYPKSVSLLIK